MKKCVYALMIFGGFLGGLQLSAATKILHQKARAARASSHNHWYGMQIDGHPWGYIHEVIEASESGLNCRIEITRQEGNGLYTEHLSAMSANDDAITPKYFNLRKFSEASGATEIVDGNYDSKTGMHVTVSGDRNFTQPPIPLAKNTILECYLPVWFQKHFEELTPNAKKTISVFAESSSTQNYSRENAYVSVPAQQKRQCKTLNMEFQDVESTWCVRPDGTYEDLAISKQKTFVKLVPDEKTAKDFLPKSGK